MVPVFHAWEKDLYRLEVERHNFVCFPPVSLNLESDSGSLRICTLEWELGVQPTVNCINANYVLLTGEVNSVPVWTGILENAIVLPPDTFSKL